MGSSSSTIRPLEPVHPPGFICRIEQNCYEGENYNSLRYGRFKYRPELPQPLQSAIHPQLWNLFIQKLDNAFETGPVEPWLAMDSEWIRVNNTRREIAQNVCNGANQNIFGPAGMRAIAQYRIVRHVVNGKPKMLWIHVVDICSNTTTVITQTISPQPVISSPPPYQAVVAQAIPVAAPVDTSPPPYQATAASPVYASPAPVYAAHPYAPYAAAPGGPAPVPVSPPASYAYPAQAYSQSQPQPAMITTNIITTHHALPQYHTPAYQSSGNASADYIPLQTQ